MSDQEPSPYATGGYISEPGSDRSDLIPAFLSPGGCFFPAESGGMVELGDVDSEGKPSPTEEHYGAEFLRRLNERGGER